MTAAIGHYDPTAMVVETLRLAGCRVTKSASGWQAQCPAHDDRSPSLSIGTGEDGRALVHCHAHCSPMDVLDALGLDPQQLFADYDPNRTKSVGITHIGAWRRKPDPKPKKPSHTKRIKTNHWDYHDENGAIVARVVRYDVVDLDTGEVVGKTFTQHAWDAENDRQLPNLGGIDVPLYRLPEVRAGAICKTTIYVCEGERDADSARSAGYVATTNAMGAGSWRPHHTKQLEGATRVVVISDNDTAGRGHAAHVAASCIAAGIDTIVVSPEPGYKDLTDHLGAGLSMGDLVLVDDIAETSDAEETGPDWWDSRPILAHIHAEAKFRLMSPWALLLAVLVKTSAEIDPHVRLPNLMVATSPINLYGCLLGPSGGGKTGTERAAAELRDWQAPTFDFGSTEGLIDIYVEPIPKKEKGDTDADTFANPFEMVPGHPELRMKNRRGLAKTDELATFLGQAGRAGNTIKGAILTAYFAGTIHPAYRHNKGLLPAGQYQLAWLVGAQPNLAWEVIEDKEVGLPQRLLWAQTRDRHAVEDAPKPEGELPWNVPADATRPGAERFIGVPDDIRREVRLARLEAVKSDEEDLSGHRMLTRLRVAAILALIEGRYTINAEDWHLSDLIVAHSDACIEMVLAERARRTAEAHKATGQAKAAAALAGAEYTAEVVTEKAAQVIARYVHKHGQVTRKQVRGAAGRWKSRDGFHLDDVLAYAVEQKWVVTVEREGGGANNAQTVTDYAPGPSQPTDAK